MAVVLSKFNELQNDYTVTLFVLFCVFLSLGVLLLGVGAVGCVLHVCACLTVVL